MNFPALRTELTTDPVALGYSGLTDVQAAAKLNALDTGRTLPRTNVPVAEIYNAIVNADWPDPGAAGTRVAESKLRGLLAMQTIDASNANTKAIIAAIFGAGTTTRANLLALATRTVSRAEEIGLGVVTAGDVGLARAKDGGW